MSQVISTIGLFVDARRWNLPRLIIGLVLAAVAGGCIVGPDNGLPPTPAPDYWHQTLKDGHYVGPDEMAEWWTLFNDPLLNHLITYSSNNNLDLYAAVTRIWQAASQRCIAASLRFMQVDGTGGYQAFRQSRNQFNFGAGGFLLGHMDMFALGLDTAWEPDLFGRITRQIQAADANVAYNVELYRDVLVTLYGEVARAYVEARTIQAQLDYAHRNIEIQRQALELARKRVEGGVSPVVDEHQAASILATTESQLPPLEFQLHQTLNRLSVLVGEYPGSLHQLLCPPQPIPKPPAELPVNVPCDVIRQRPDIRAAERLVAQRTAEIGVAISDLYPRFNLGGTIGLTSQNFSQLFESDSLGYQLGPTFRWPIFRGKSILCNIEGRYAALEEAIAVYQQTILLAAEEIENAIVAYNKELVRLDALQDSVVANQKSLESVMELYRGGKTNFQNVLDTQRSLALSQNARAASEGQVILNLIALFKALGGGWDPDHHCDRSPVRLRCPERGDASLCDELRPTEVEDAEQLPSPGEIRRAEEDILERSTPALPGLPDADSSPLPVPPEPGSTEDDLSPRTSQRLELKGPRLELPKVRSEDLIPAFRPFQGE